MQKTLFATLSTVAFLLGATQPARAQTDAIDLLIKNARVIDGTGAPAYQSDIAVRGDTILRIAPRIDSPATKLVDARGKVLAPGSSTSTSMHATTFSKCRLPTTTCARA